MNTCMMCGKEFNSDYKAQKLCKECLDKFTHRYYDYQEYRKQGHTRRPTCIVCDRPMTRGFSTCTDCRATWKKIYCEIMRPKTLIRARHRAKQKKDNAAREALKRQVRTGLNEDIAAARKAGLSYGAYMVRKKGLVR